MASNYLESLVDWTQNWREAARLQRTELHSRLRSRQRQTRRRSCTGRSADNHRQESTAESFGHGDGLCGIETVV